jgi:predicted kinase
LFAVVVAGPPGSGKTTVLTALENALADDGIEHAAIEVEAISWSHPPVSDEQSFLHLAAIRQMYAKAGYSLILCGATITSRQYLDGLLAALSAHEYLLIRLEGDPLVLRQRIIDREPPSWSGLPDLIESTEAIAATSRLLPGVDAVFSTTDTSSLQIAEQIRLMRPDVLAGPGKNPTASR